jgi:hypothetical protein
VHSNTQQRRAAWKSTMEPLDWRYQQEQRRRRRVGKLVAVLFLYSSFSSCVTVLCELCISGSN